MKNTSFNCTDGTTIVVINRRSGNTLHARISTSKLPVVAAISGSWCAMTTPRGDVYCYSKDYSGNKSMPKGKRSGGGRNIYMHRLCAGLDASDPREVNHLDWDTLNCTDGNLEPCSHAINMAHRQLTDRPTARNSSGYRNVQRRADGFQVVVAGKYIGFSRDLAEARRMAARARASYTGANLAAGMARKSAAIADISTRSADNRDRWMRPLERWQPNGPGQSAVRFAVRAI
jgi:hypothetical protein